MRTVELHDAFEILESRGGLFPALLTCEHASMRLPKPWEWPDQDRRLVGDHWSWDPGAAEVCADLARAVGACAVLSRFTRLLCDPNRAEGTENLFRDVADGLPIALNVDLKPDDRERRLAGYHRPFHAAVDRAALDHPGRLVFSVHTFSPIYEGQRRAVEVAVLYDHAEDDLGHRLVHALEQQGLRAWHNEPWSGKDGLIYSAARAAAAHGRRPLELEVRNDLATDPGWREHALPRIARALEALVTQL